MKRTNIYKKLIIKARGKIRSARITKTLSKKPNHLKKTPPKALKRYF